LRLEQMFGFARFALHVVHRVFVPNVRVKAKYHEGPGLRRAELRVIGYRVIEIQKRFSGPMMQCQMNQSLDTSASQN